MNYKLRMTHLELVDFKNCERLTLEFITGDGERYRLFVDLDHGMTPTQISQRLLDMAVNLEKLT